MASGICMVSHSLYIGVYKMAACIHSFRFVLRSRESIPAFSAVQGRGMRDVTFIERGLHNITDTFPFSRSHSTLCWHWRKGWSYGKSHNQNCYENWWLKCWQAGLRKHIYSGMWRSQNWSQDSLRSLSLISVQGKITGETMERHVFTKGKPYHGNNIPCRSPTLLMEVSMTRCTVLNDRNLSSPESCGSKGALRSPARTTERSQRRHDLGAFNLLATRRNLMIRSCFPRIFHHYIVMRRTYTFKVDGESLRSNFSCMKKSTTLTVHLCGSLTERNTCQQTDPTSEHRPA